MCSASGDPIHHMNFAEEEMRFDRPIDKLRQCIDVPVDPRQTPYCIPEKFRNDLNFLTALRDAIESAICSEGLDTHVPLLLQHLFPPGFLVIEGLGLARPQIFDCTSIPTKGAVNEEYYLLRQTTQQELERSSGCAMSPFKEIKFFDGQAAIKRVSHSSPCWRHTI